MKVYIGPYRNWIGPYQIAELFKFVGFSKERQDQIGDYLNKTWVKKFCEWIDSKKQVKRKIRIDNYDIWNMGDTLSYIIHPMLLQLKRSQHGAPFTDDSDVPEGLNLRSSEAPPVKEWEADENIFKRWEWILDEMIWTFEQFTKEDDPNDKDQERIKNGLRLFGKYYQGLWD